MRNLDFNDIRPLGSLNEGFEELVCQLAHRMNVPNGKRFVRNGRPDGGAECYWELNNGDVWMWQAKFFATVPGASQFEQINDSVRTALRLHKNVKRYFIALPQDLPDDGKAGTKSAKKRYDEKVKQWNKIEGAADVEFNYWGKHELLDILSRKENEGLVHFWFNKTEFTEKDFEIQNKKAIDALGARYTPELNIELEIAKAFDGLSRNNRFEERFKSALSKYKSVWQRIYVTDKDQRSDTYLKLMGKVKGIINEGGKIEFGGIATLPIENLVNQIKSASETVESFIAYLEKKQKEKIQEKNEYINENFRRVDYSYTIRDARELYYESSRLKSYLEETECKAANQPIILLEGEAGVGKSHLLADVVEGRRKDKRYSLFFLGQHFNAQEDPWTQIFKQLKFNGTDTEFLQALEAKAETTGQRIIIFIDALNEGGGKELWSKHIRSFVNQIKEYRWLGLVMSIRTTYTRVIFEEELEGVLRLTHRGFENRSFDAIKLFFKNSHITLPSVPLLLPEFKNPLFLKLFCDGLHKNGLSRIDEGMQGISSVIDLFIAGVEKDLSSPKKKDYLPELHVVRKAVNRLIDYQVEHLTTEVPLDKAIELTDDVKTDKFSNGELLYELVSYGVLTRNMRYRGERENEEVVYLSYERFNDFLTAQRLFEKSDDAEAAVRRFIKEDHDLWYYGGIVESLAIIIPEKVGKEVYEILPEYRDSDQVVDSVMKSLLWRKKTTIDQKLVDYFNEVVTDEQRSWNFMSILIQVGPTTNHFFNAEFLHRNLMKWDMAKRDHRWSICLHYLSGERDNAVETLITWAKEDFGQAEIDAESKYLAAIVLGWFTTCMDRRIRDNASKGLISLVRDDVNLMMRLIDKFEGVDDPYVVERIYAAAYGCTLMSKSTAKLQELAKCIYNHIFDKEGEIYPNALVRDYAKGVIEYTLTLYPDTELGEKPFAPPYKSTFIENFPTDEETMAYSKKDKDGKWLTPGIDYILESMVTEHGYTLYGDFGRYVFQSHLDGWNFDPQKLSNLAVKWIMGRYGYKEEFFGEYDRSIGYGRMRQVYPGERVGKKYQWIALHEMVARLSDNYPMEDRWSNRVTEYNGTWEPFLRDFDPTMLVQERIPAWYEAESRYWWNSIDYSEWNCERKEWTRREDNLPDPAKVIESKDEDGTSWLALEAMPDWVEPHDKDAGVYCNLWYQIRSYIIDEDKFGDFALWAIDQNFSGRWMPEVSDRYEMFGREFYWSPAFKYYEDEGMTIREVLDPKSREKVADVELPCIKFLWESEYDYSKPKTVSYLKPSKQLFEGLDMRYSDIDGELVDENGKLLCFDTSVNHNSHGYFLVRKDALIQYLKVHCKRILWVMIGEKNLMGSMIPHSEWLEMSGAYYLDPKEEVKGSMTAYLEGKPLGKPKKNKQKINILENYQSSKTTKIYFDSELRHYSVNEIKNMVGKGGKLNILDSMSGDIWDVEKRSKYLESLLSGLPLTSIMTTRRNDGKLEVLDGGQRVKAIVDYLNGKFALRNLNMMDLYEDCRYDELPSMAKSRLMYAEIPFNVITSPVDEKMKAELYNRLNIGIHQISERNRRLLQYRGRMTDVMDALLKDKHFKSLTKDSRDADKEMTKEDIAFRLIVDYVVTQGNDSFVSYLSKSYEQQLKDVAKFVNERVEEYYVEEMRKRLKAVLKDMDDIFGMNIMQRIDEKFSLPLMEILTIAFLFNKRSVNKEIAKDIVYNYIEDNAFKISHSGNDSPVKFRERLMLALNLNQEMNR